MERQLIDRKYVKAGGYGKTPSEVSEWEKGSGPAGDLLPDRPVFPSLMAAPVRTAIGDGY